MTLEEFRKVKEVIHKRIQWDEESILDMEQGLGILYQDIQDILSNEKLTYENLLNDRDRIYGKLYKNFKFEGEEEWGNKNEIDSQIKNNEEYYKKTLECNRLAVIVEYLESSLKNITSIGYQIRDYIKWKMFKSGRDF